MPGKGIKADIMDFLVSRAGTPASIGLVAEKLDITRSQASQALAAFVASGDGYITRVSSGIYVYTGPPAYVGGTATTTPTHVDPPAVNGRQHQQPGESPAEPFTIIGQNKAKELMVRDAHGVVYRLVEV